jgi:hypothetical protein
VSSTEDQNRKRFLQTATTSDTKTAIGQAAKQAGCYLEAIVS